VQRVVQERLLAHSATLIRHSKTLQKTAIFQHLSSGAISKIIDLMDYRSFDVNDKLVVQGDLGTEFMVIVKAVNFVKIQKVVNTLGGLDFLGEGALVHDDHYRGATVVAKTLTQVLILSYERYQELLLDGTIEKKTHETLAELSASYKVSIKVQDEEKSD
jgi:CRP-like cAMP-binding protein